MEVAIVLGLITVAALSHCPANLICGYIKSKPVGLQRLVDLIYSDVARLLNLLLLLFELLMMMFFVLAVVISVFACGCSLVIWISILEPA
jgi:hypothetical protein